MFRSCGYVWISGPSPLEDPRDHKDSVCFSSCLYPVVQELSQRLVADFRGGSPNCNGVANSLPCPFGCISVVDIVGGAGQAYLTESPGPKYWSERYRFRSHTRFFKRGLQEAFRRNPHSAAEAIHTLDDHHFFSRGHGWVLRSILAQFPGA